jgi:hypothetical protein
VVEHLSNKWFLFGWVGLIYRDGKTTFRCIYSRLWGIKTYVPKTLTLMSVRHPNEYVVGGRIQEADVQRRHLCS